MNTKTKPVTLDLFDQALKNYEDALKTGIKLQSDAYQQLSDAMLKAGPPEEFVKRLTAAVDQIVPEAQKRIEEGFKLAEKTSKDSLELLSKMLESAKKSTPADAQQKAADLWKSSMTAVQNNVQALTDANTKVVATWVGLVKQSLTPVTGGQ
jgi:DNA-directed RNA polymerase sigma subunit (sigma70/sigma32)